MLPTRLKAAKSEAAPLPPKYFAVAVHATSPFLSAYEWDDATGFGVKIANPSTALPSTAAGLDSNSTPKTGTTTDTADVIFVAHGSSPYISAYNFSRNGFGTKIANPSSLPNSTGNAITVHPTLQAVCMSTTSSPYLHAYQWNNTTKAFGTKYANPPTGLNTSTTDVHFKPTSTTTSGHIAGCMANSPRIVIFNFTIASGFGTKVANPAVIPGSTMISCRFSFNGTRIAGTASTAPFVHVWQFSTVFGTKFTDPISTNRPNGSPTRIRFRAGDTGLFIAHNGAPYLTVYVPWQFNTTAFPTKAAAPATALQNVARSLAINSGTAGGDVVLMGYSTTPYIAAYKWGTPTVNTWGTRYSNPATALPAFARDVMFVQGT